MVVYVDSCSARNFVTNDGEQCVHQCVDGTYWEEDLQIRCVPSCESGYAKRLTSEDTTFTC